jgi:hypothetical protein
VDEIIETKWRCLNCATVNRGPDMKCSMCGDQKAEDIEYFIDENAPVVTDREQIADANAGEHWTCSYCNRSNKQRNKSVCEYCGCSRLDGEKSKSKPPPAVRYDPIPSPPTQRESPPSTLKQVLPKVGLFMLALVAALGVTYALIPNIVTGRVAMKSWERAVQVQKNTAVDHTDWIRNVPGGAFDQSCQTKQHGTRDVVDHYRDDPRTRQVLDHYNTRTVTKYRSVRKACGSTERCSTTNLKNGYARRSCHSETKYCTGSEPYSDTARDPVYRTERYTVPVAVYRTEPVYDQWCAYKAWEWVNGRVVRHQGTLEDPSWPTDSEISLATDERGQRSEAFQVVFQNLSKNDPPNFEYHPKSENEFLGLRMSTDWRLKIGAFGGVEVLEQQQAKN